MEATEEEVMNDKVLAYCVVLCRACREHEVRWFKGISSVPAYLRSVVTGFIAVAEQTVFASGLP